MKKKILTLSLVVALAATAIIGGTLAYFTDTDADVNVMKTGNLDIEQIEVFEQNDELLPGKDGELAVNKDVTIKNNGSVDAWVRTLFAFEDTQDLCTAVHYNSAYYNQFVFPSNNTDNWLQIKATVTKADGTTEDTVYTVGYLVYPEILKANTESNKVLDAIWLDETATNKWTEVAGDNYDVLVLTQAVQAEGFDTAAEAFAAETSFGEITMDSDPTVADWFKPVIEAKLAEGETVTVTGFNYVNDPWYN